MNIRRFAAKLPIVSASLAAVLLVAAGWRASGLAAPFSWPIASAQAAESGHEGGCGGEGESGSTHGAKGAHDEGGEEGHGRGASGGHGGGHDIGNTIFRGHGRRSGTSEGHAGGSHETGIGDTVFRGHGRRGGSHGAAESGSEQPGGAAGGRGHAGGSSGSLYGNLWVVLRNPATGAPILDSNGNVQPILPDGTVVQLTAEGDLPAAYSDQVQSVEFSRLNVARAPSQVSGKALQRALDTIRSAETITRDAAGRIVTIGKDGAVSTIDSPLENLALYEDAIRNGAFTAQQAAAFLGAAADKTQPISLDIVVYLNTILGLNGTSGSNYVDYTHFHYDRAAVYSGDVTYLVANGDGSYSTVVKPVMQAVFHDQNVDSTGAAAFAQAADDARAVIQFVHDNSVDSE